MQEDKTQMDAIAKETIKPGSISKPDKGNVFTDSFAGSTLKSEHSIHDLYIKKWHVRSNEVNI